MEHKFGNMNTLPCSIIMSATEGNRTCFSFFNTPKHGRGTGLVTCYGKTELLKVDK